MQVGRCDFWPHLPANLRQQIGLEPGAALRDVSNERGTRQTASSGRVRRDLWILALNLAGDLKPGLSRRGADELDDHLVAHQRFAAQFCVMKAKSRCCRVARGNLTPQALLEPYVKSRFIRLPMFGR
jgi:hypothetical protein